MTPKLEHDPGQLNPALGIEAVYEHGTVAATDPNQLLDVLADHLDRMGLFACRLPLGPVEDLGDRKAVGDGDEADRGDRQGPGDGLPRASAQTLNR